MSATFSFGEHIEGYAVPVLNERAVRAAAGTVFVFAMASFMNAWLIGNFQPTRVSVVASLVVCALCLLLLFFESAFGICIGCKVYNAFNKEQAQLCPGGVCDFEPAPGAGGSRVQFAVVAAFAGLIGVWTSYVLGNDPYSRHREPAQAAVAQVPVDPAEAGRCKVPDFAKALSHEAMWKLHNNCK